MSIIKSFKACDLVIFGTKGDLAKRKLLPSLYKLETLEQIHKETRIIGVGRAHWNKEKYINIVKKSILDFSLEKVDQKILQKLTNRFYFLNLDVNDTNKFYQLKKLLDQKNHHNINYFAMPPDTFGAICKGLGMACLNKKPACIVIEKPLGLSLKTSKDINNSVGKFFEESQIFRIDHYLGKETILNLLALRFSNSIFMHNWNKNIIDHIQITVAEEVGIEGRWNYFNHVGQTRDMVQNHLLQILTIIAMSTPTSLNADSIRDEKVKILHDLRQIDYKNIDLNTARGQYSSGLLNGQKVLGYLEESDAQISKSDTETFVAIRVDIDNSRWSGVPFYLRTGKRLPKKYSEIVIYFKQPKINIFKDLYPILAKNKLIIRLQPNEGIDFEFLNKVPSINNEYNLKPMKMSLNYFKDAKESCLIDAYERLLLDVMQGLQNLFVRRDEVELAWEWIDSIIYAWNIKRSKIELYPAGTWGPNSSREIIERDGFSWHSNI